jgi:hypothetical protein
MNEQYFGERIKTTPGDEESDQMEKNPVENSDHSTDKPPVLADLVQHTPFGAGTVPTAETTGEPIVHQDPLGETIPFNDPKSEKVPSSVIPAVPGTGSLAALLEPDEAGNFRKRWNEIQGTFVDEPRTAVQQADALVSEVVGKITQVFANEHTMLEGQWKKGNDVSTEDLRKALQHYREFFNRLVV